MPISKFRRLKCYDAILKWESADYKGYSFKYPSSIWSHIFQEKKRNNNHAGVPKINKIKNGGNCAKKCIFYDTLFTVERPLLIETDMIVCLETLQSLTCFFFQVMKARVNERAF